MASGVILALHTTWDVVGAALLGEGKLLAAAQLEGGRAAILLASAIQEILTRAGLRLEDVGKLAVATGPGSFTGIKVGLATAYGLSRSLGIGIAGIGSLEVLAAQADAAEPAIALLPAGRGELYAARYGDGERKAVQEPFLATPAEVREKLAGTGPAVHLGCEALLAEAGLEGATAADPGRLAEDLARLASRVTPLPAGEVPSPVYLRRTWAEEARDKRTTAQ